MAVRARAILVKQLPELDEEARLEFTVFFGLPPAAVLKANLMTRPAGFV